MDLTPPPTYPPSNVASGVRSAIKDALKQMPASATLDLALVSVRTEDEAAADAALEELAQALPGHMAIVGWAGPVGGKALAPVVRPPGGVEVRELAAHGGISITLASLPSVSGGHGHTGPLGLGSACVVGRRARTPR
jgi:hypothetical protein